MDVAAAASEIDAASSPKIIPKKKGKSLSDLPFKQLSKRCIALGHRLHRNVTKTEMIEMIESPENFRVRIGLVPVYITSMFGPSTIAQLEGIYRDLGHPQRGNIDTWVSALLDAGANQTVTASHVGALVKNLGSAKTGPNPAAFPDMCHSCKFLPQIKKCNNCGQISGHQCHSDASDSVNTPSPPSDSAVSVAEQTASDLRADLNQSCLNDSVLLQQLESLECERDARGPQSRVSETEVQALRDDNKLLRKQVLAEVESMQKAYDTKHAETQTEIARLNLENEQLREQVAGGSFELDTVKASHTEALQDLDKILQAYETYKTNKGAEIETLNSKYKVISDAHKKELDVCRASQHKAEQDLEAVTLEYANYRAGKDADAAKILKERVLMTTSQQKVEKQALDIEALGRQCEQLQTELHQSASALAKTKTECDDLRKQEADAQNLLAECQASLKTRIASFHDQELRLARATATKDALQTCCQQVLRELARLRQEGNLIRNDVQQHLIQATTTTQQFSKVFAELRSEELQRLHRCILKTRASHVALKHEVATDMLPNLAAMIAHAYTAMLNKASAVDELCGSVNDVIGKYQYEAHQRKLLYNRLQEIRGNIRVFCRVRKDDSDSEARAITIGKPKTAYADPTLVQCLDAHNRSKDFTFDRAYPDSTTQAQVFEDTEPIITSCADGYNVCFIAYGQTGSGKTHTMLGTEGDPGVSRRAIKALLRICKARTAIDYTIRASLMEIYNDKIIDLLSDIPPDEQKVDLRMDPTTKTAQVANLYEHPITCEQDVVETLARGETNRSVAETKMNAKSSRSHLLLQLYVTGHDALADQTTHAKLTLVDLAGSERILQSEVTGERLVETKNILKSLSALGHVFQNLRTGQGHIPYRNSKLTHVLQDSLGGDAKTCVFITVSPHEKHVTETLSTLQFGASVRQIHIKARRRESIESNPDENA